MISYKILYKNEEIEEIVIEAEDKESARNQFQKMIGKEIVEIYNREVDEILDEDLEAAGEIYDRMKEEIRMMI